MGFPWFRNEKSSKLPPYAQNRDGKSPVDGGEFIVRPGLGDEVIYPDAEIKPLSLEWNHEAVDIYGMFSVPAQGIGG